MKLAEYAVSVVVVESSSNSSVKPLLRIKISFFLLSAWIEGLLSTPNIITFLPNPSPLGSEKAERESNLIPYP